MYIIICNKFIIVSLLQMVRHHDENGKHRGLKIL